MRKGKECSWNSISCHEGLIALLLSLLLTSCGKPTEEQKLPRESAPKAPPSAVEVKTSPAPKKVDVRIKAGIVLKSGDVKPIARTDFVLSKLSLAKLYDEELAANPPPSAEAFCRTQGFSPEFLDLLATFKWDLDAFCSSLRNAGSDTEQLMKSAEQLPPKERKIVEELAANAKKGLTVDQVIRVPELKKPYDDGYSRAVAPFGLTGEAAETNRRNEGLQHVYSYVDGKVNNLSSDYVEAIGNAMKEALAHAQARVLAGRLVIAKTSLTGEAVFREIPAGDYFISNVEYSEIGERRNLWDFPIKVSGIGENYIELSNDNECDLYRGKTGSLSGGTQAR